MGPEVLTALIGILLAILYRRVILRTWRIRKFEKTVNELADFFEENYKGLISQKHLTQDQIAQHFGCNFWKKFYTQKFNSEVIDYASVEELRKKLSRLCDELREKVETLEAIYGKNSVAQEAKELLREVTLKIRRTMWINNETY